MILIKGLLAGVAALLMWMLPLPPYTPEPNPSLYITVYDWGLGGINCDGDCSRTALVPTGDDILGHVAACPVSWLGYINTTVVTIWGQDFWCVDTFGSPRNREMTFVKGEVVFRIDLAYRPASEHKWNNEFVPPPDWSVRWEPMAEFERLRAEEWSRP